MIQLLTSWLECPDEEKPEFVKDSSSSRLDHTPSDSEVEMEDAAGFAVSSSVIITLLTMVA